MAKKNPPKGTTRTEMTKEELEWMQRFINWDQSGDKKSLKKIIPEGTSLQDVVARQDEAFNAKRRDIYSNMKAVRSGEHESDVPDDREHYIVDDSANPAYPKRERNKRYTAEDYNKPGVPDEDGLIDLLDFEKGNSDENSK